MANQPDVVTQQSVSSEPDPLERVETLEVLQEAGAISAEEFEAKKGELLDEV